MRTIRLMSAGLCCMLMFSGPAVVAQHTDDTHGGETLAQVPALTKFHVPIYTLWHTAWPQKDTAMMASLVPAITQGVAAIAQAELPGILRDKKTVWQEQVKALEGIASEYTAAMAGSATQAKLDAAEKLHMQYERLVRITRPVMKEIDAFHAVLYMLYHYYMPERQSEKIAHAAKDLRARMDTLDAAKLPDRLKKKEESFLAARAKLSASVNALNAMLPSNDEKKITQAINTLHTDYQSLEKVFE